MSILNPFAFYLLPLLGVILFFYLLKGRPRELIVASAIFWQRVRQTLTSQRLRWRLPPELILFLQLAILSLLIMALAQIILAIRTRGGEYLAIVMDTTASMQATDLVPNRLSVAKKRAQELIRKLPKRTRIALIQADDRPHLLVNFSDARSKLSKEMENLNALDVQGDEETALRLAASLFPPNIQKEIIFFTDGAFKFSPDSINQGVKLVLLGNEAPYNLGIISLKIRPRLIGKRDYEVLVGVGNFSPQKESFSLRLWLEEELISVKKLSLPPKEEGQYVYSVRSEKRAILRAQIESHSRDDLAIDNVAYAVFGPSKNLDVLLVSQRNLFLETVLSAYSCIDLSLKDKATSQEISNYDVVIFDGIIPPSLARGNVVCIGTLPLEFLSEDTDIQINPILTEWEADHPLLRFVELNNTNVERSLSIPPLAGGQVLIESIRSPLLQIWQRGSLNMVFIAFDLYYSDFPLQVGFPIFIFNLLQWFHPELFDPNYYQIRTGESFPIPPEYKEGEIFILNPHNQVSKIEKTEDHSLFSQTKVVGIYKLNEETIFAANLLSSQESDLFKRVDLPSLNENIQGHLEGTPLKNKINISSLLIFIACLLLLIEWRLYHFPLRRHR